MKIERSKVKKSSSEVPLDCRILIDKLKGCSREEFLSELIQIETWTYGKCELYHWIEILDLCDDILEDATKRDPGSWVLGCDKPGEEARKLKEVVLQTLHFTTLLIEHSFSRHLYSSMEHLSLLLSSFDMEVVLAVLNLLYMFSKRSNFISRLAPDKRQLLLNRLSHLAGSWGGKDNGFGLSKCCSDDPMSSFPSSATTLHFEFYAEAASDQSRSKPGGSLSSVVTVIHVPDVDKLDKTPAAIMEDILQQYNVPEEKQMLLFTFVRLAHGFSSYGIRLKCVQARLQALSVLIYSNQLTDSVQGLLYSGLLEELVDVLEMKGEHLMEIKAAVLKALTSIIHLDRNPNFPKLNTIIDATGAANFHGFLPVMVRNCIISLTSTTNTSASPAFPQPLATALFSFLYHLASYESGGEALVSCGMLESLLKVIQWPSSELEHITFVTRAVRVIDLITNLDMASFQTHAGLTTFINRLELEVDHCRKHQPFQIQVGTKEERLTKVIEEAETIHDEAAIAAAEELAAAAQSSGDGSGDGGEESMEVDPVPGTSSGASPAVGSSSALATHLIQQDAPKPGLTCLPQRAALLKSMLNFLKKAIQDPAFSDSIRHVMEGSLPNSLKHIISNAEYYGPSLFLLATDVVTAYVFQEPSFLSSLQDKGLTDVVLHALLVKEVPATREVLASLPNVFSALCLNTRGLEAFVACKPFERLFKVLLSPDYLPAMRRRRSADPLGDTASNLGNAMDELMRHQPSLKQAATAAIIKLLEQVCTLGRDSKYICWKSSGKGGGSTEGSNTVPDGDAGGNANSGGGGGGGGGAEASSDEEEEEEVDEGGTREEPREDAAPEPTSDGSAKEPVPLVDYVLNVMKFVDAILSNNSTDDHCREFVSQKGLVPLMGVLGLPNLPVDFPAQPACQSVASVCKSILNLAHEPQVLKQGLLHLKEVLNLLEPLHVPVPAPGSSVLLHELVSNSNPTEAINNPAATPLLHNMSAAHAYITMFVHVCRTGQADIRTISVSHWGSELGLQVLESLSRLYTSLVWESTVLLALCSEDTTLVDTQFGKADMEKLIPGGGSSSSNAGSAAGTSTDMLQPSSPASGASVDSGAGVTSAMEQLTTDSSDSNMDTGTTGAGESSGESKDKKTNPQLQAQIKQIKPLLSGSSRLGRALAELFGLLVKLCVGSPLRQRRGQQVPPLPSMPSPPARAVATALTKLLTSGLSWQPPSTSPLPKFRLTFFICSVGFTSPMLFDEKKFPYHLMLYQFVSGGGQKAFFDAFYWAITLGDTVNPGEGLENPNLPDRTGEFLDAWLMLLEKMVNPKNVLESPHMLPDKAGPNFKPFDTLAYLIKTHKTAFEAVMHIWGKKPLQNYGWRMSESVLSILCHILKGETLIKEKLEKEKPEEKSESAAASAAGSSSAAPGSVAAASAAVAIRAAGAAAPAAAAVGDPNWATSTPAEPDINPEHLQTLQDMGFARERCIEAIQSVGGSLDAATDYLLNNPVPPLLQSGLGPQYDLLRAIEMSLGESGDEAGAGASGAAGTATAVPPPPEPEPEETLSPSEQERVKEQVIDTFTEKALQGCLTLLDTLPDTVYRVTDLLIAIFQRNGDNFKKKLLTELMVEVKESVRALLDCAHNNNEVTDDLLTTGPSAKAAVRTHLFSLLFDDCSKLCVKLVEESDTMKEIVELIEITQTVLMKKSAKESESRGEGGYTPKWITPILLFIDLYEKIVLSMKRRSAMKPLVSNSWKWFDISTGKWCAYQPPQNKIIDDAFWAGESTAKITTGRRKYVIRFAAMVQSNEESGNKRPVMLSLKEKPKPKKDEDKNKEEAKGEDKPEDMETSEDSGPFLPEIDELLAKEQPPVDEYNCTGLSQDSCIRLLRSCVHLIGLPVEPDALNAIMRLCLRLTREFDLAAQFAELGGIRLLLGLKQNSNFTGFNSLASLLVRHVLEDPATLRHTVEKVVRSATLGNNAATTRELHYILRFLAPAAARNPTIFTEVGRDILRVDLSLLNKRGEPEDDLRLLMKSLSPKSGSTAPPLQEISKTVIYDLLDFLVVSSPEAATSEPAQDKAQDKPEEELPASVVSILSAPGTVAAQSGSAASTDSFPGSSRINNTTRTQEQASTAKEEKSKEEKVVSSKPLLPKSGICRLLAEMVKSYAGCARLITEHHYNAGISELVKEDCTAMAFILDELLTDTKDKECSNLVRMLVAAIASCNHAPEAQTSLVTEVKNALSRSLALPECNNKHTKIQALTGLISTMIDSCPPSPGTSSAPFKQPGVNINNIVKCMLKKGLITDLARVPHALDLSSPGMAASVNAAMKPLETLSKLVNQPTSLPLSKTTKSKPETEETQNRNVNTNTTNSEATRAQGEEVGGNEAEATEHDLSTTASADPNSESGQLNTVEESFPEEFDSMMDQLLERDNTGESNILAEVSMVQSDRRMEESEDMAEEDTGADEAGDPGEDTEAHSEVISDSDSSHSQDTEGSGEDEEEGEDLEEGEEEGEDEDEEDDDTSGGFLEDEQDDFQDLDDAAFLRMPSNLDREFDSVMMVGMNDGYGLGEDRLSLQPSLWGNGDGGDGGGADGSGGLGGSGSHVTPSHPLLMGRSAGDAQSLISRTQNRTLQRSRGFRYIQLNPRNGGPGGPGGPIAPGTPAILQSLLGTDTSRHLPSFILNSQSRNNLHDARVVLLEPTGAGGMDFDTTITILDGLDDELTGGENGVLGGGGGGSGSASLTTIPNALVRWTDESRVLDGESVHDCVTAIKPDLLEVVEKHREEEFAERREKKRKQQEEEERQAKKNEEEKKARGEPEAATTPAPESAGGQVADGDEMDVVVSENSAVASLTGGDELNTRTSLTDTVSRLSEDLVNAISSRMSTGLPARGSDLLSGVSGSSSSSGTTSSSSTTTDSSSLNTVLQTLTSTFAGTGVPPPPPNETSTPLETANPPTFHFAAPSSAFPNIPIRLEPLPALQETSGSSTAPPPPPVPPPDDPVTDEAAAPPLPDALAPLSPSPDDGATAVGAATTATTTGQEDMHVDTAEAAAARPSAAAEQASAPSGQAEATAATDGSVEAAEQQQRETEQPQEEGDSQQDGSQASGDQSTVTDKTEQEDREGVEAGDGEANTEAGPSGAGEAGAGPAPASVPPPPVDDYSSILGDIEIPEGVDPSFLAALPEDMRQEVIEEQRRLLRARQAPPAPPPPTEGVGEVNPEFLAALPPNIQEEVLAQQRLEQQRQSQAQADPSAPVDPSEFLQTLPPSLRQSLLAEMEDSQISALPAEIAAEAQTLRRDFEQRNRALMHERFFNHVNHPTSTLSSILRSTVNRIGGYTVHSNSGGGGGSGRSVWSRPIGRGGPGHQHNAALLAAQTNAKFKGRQLLDHEGLSCLLILLFIDDSKLNTARLHKILRNLCYHAPTRDWVIKCLLSILEKANSCPDNASVTAAASSADPMTGGTGSTTPPPAKLRKSVSNTSGASGGGGKVGSCSGASDGSISRGSSQTSWLNISMDAALGFRANVFQVQRPHNTVGGKKQSNTVISGTNIKVHPQAAPVVCKNTLELLISLAKSFSIHFLPGTLSSSSTVSSDNASSSEQRKRLPEFWETLLKLDKECWTSRKGKSVVRSHSSVGVKNEEDDSQAVINGTMSAFGQLLSMLASPVIKRSSLLTDKLLRLLSLISLGQPDTSKAPIATTSTTAVAAITVAGTSSSSTTDEADSKPGPSSSQQSNSAPATVEKAVSSDQIKLAVEVLTSKACSEEGLEDVTALLLNLSYVGTQTRESILFLLLEGARQLGRVVSDNVSTLLKELRELKGSGALTALLKEEEEENKQKGVLADRFTKESVVLTAPTKPKAGGELQLSSMSALTSKTSSQSFFLRVLKVIIQLREAALHAMQKSLKAKKDEEVFAAAKKAAAMALRGVESGEDSAAMEENTESAAAGATTEASESTTDSNNSTPQPSATPATDADPAAPAPDEADVETPMEVDDDQTPASSADASGTENSQASSSRPPAKEEKNECYLESLSEQLDLTQLWETLSACLRELADTPDHHAVLVLQPTVEAFFLVHAAATTNTEKKKTNQKETRQEQLAHIQEDKQQEDQVNLASSSSPELSPDTTKFLEFAETHRTVLNQILRQSTTHLADGPFSVLVDHTRVLDFDIKRRYFRTELERLNEGMRREDLAVHVRRESVFEESFRELHRRSAEEWKNRFYIVFEGEEGQDAGGLLREWYVIISREIFNPNYALFKSSPGDRVTYTINDFSHINSNHLDYFKFVGRVIAKAIYDNKLLECYFTRSFYKHILAKAVRHQDMESEDYEFYKGLEFLLEHDIADLGYDLTFSTEIQEFGVTEVRDLIPNGRNIQVSDENKVEYVRLVCQMKMTGAIRKQLAAFLEGFYDIIPRRLISIFNEQELELLLSGLPDINIDDLKANTEYHKYTATSLQIVWFWRALRGFDQTDRAKFLQFVTGSSKVPLQGFGALEGMNGAQKFQIHRDDRSTDRLPAAHTCFNQLDLPVYETYDKLRSNLLKAIHECSEGFGFA